MSEQHSLRVRVVSSRGLLPPRLVVHLRVGPDEVVSPPSANSGDAERTWGWLHMFSSVPEAGVLHAKVFSGAILLGHAAVPLDALRAGVAADKVYPLYESGDERGGLRMQLLLLAPPRLNSAPDPPGATEADDDAAPAIEEDATAGAPVASVAAPPPAAAWERQPSLPTDEPLVPIPHAATDTTPAAGSLPTELPPAHALSSTSYPSLPPAVPSIGGGASASDMSSAQPQWQPQPQQPQQQQWQPQQQQQYYQPLQQQQQWPPQQPWQQQQQQPWQQQQLPYVTGNMGSSQQPWPAAPMPPTPVWPGSAGGQPAGPASAWGPQPPQWQQQQQQQPAPVYNPYTGGAPVYAPAGAYVGPVYTPQQGVPPPAGWTVKFQ